MIKTKQRSRWREFEFMFRDVCRIIEPRPSLQNTLNQWGALAKGLAEGSRTRKLQNLG